MFGIDAIVLDLDGTIRVDRFPGSVLKSFCAEPGYVFTNVDELRKFLGLN